MSFVVMVASSLLLLLAVHAAEADENEAHRAASAGDATALNAIHTSLLQQTDRDQYTPLHLAAGFGHADSVAALLGRGVDVDPADDVGETPLHLAAHAGHTAVVALLVDTGALVNRPSTHGYTPLHMAAEKGHAATVELLALRGADLAIADGEGATPLHWAAHHSHADTFLALLNAWARRKREGGGGGGESPLQLRDGSGQTPLSLLTKSADRATLDRVKHFVHEESERRRLRAESSREL